jgi:hypothetical protein
MLIEPEERPGSRAGSWYSRWLFERALALIYFTAFLVAVNQFDHLVVAMAAFSADVRSRAHQVARR